MLRQSGAITIPFLLLLLTPSFSFSQSDSLEAEERTVDVLYLKDGSVLKGRILGYARDTVRMELSGGHRLKFPREQVERIELDVAPEKDGKSPEKEGTPPKEEKGPEKDTPPEEEEEEEEEEGSIYYDPNEGESLEKEKVEKLHGSRYHREGYQHHLGNGWFINVGDTPSDLSFLLNPQAYSFHTYRFSPHLAAGIYAGVQVLGDSRSYGPLNSLGFNFTGDILKNSGLTPFWDAQLGFSHSAPGLNMVRGFFGNIGGGAKVYFNNTKGMSVLLTYQVYDLKQEMNGVGGRPITREDFIAGMSIRLTMHL